ncbi:hypothetical protein U1Q18_037252, partial [Sarracenia purpurea var. burkii]
MISPTKKNKRRYGSIFNCKCGIEVPHRWNFPTNQEASIELRSGLELGNQTWRGGDGGGGGVTATRSDLVRSRFRRGRSGLEDGGGGW